MNIRLAKLEDTHGIAKVHVDSWRTTFRGIVSDEYLQSLSYEQREEMRKRGLSNPDRKDFVFVAEDETGRIDGFAHGGPEVEGNLVYKGELYAIYLLEEAQRKGIGQQLAHSVIKKLKESGYNSMLVWVLKDNPSRHFYESLGGQPVMEKTIEIGDQSLIEVAYGWTEIK